MDPFWGGFIAGGVCLGSLVALGCVIWFVRSFGKGFERF